MTKQQQQLQHKQQQQQQSGGISNEQFQSLISILMTSIGMEMMSRWTPPAWIKSKKLISVPGFTLANFSSKKQFLSFPGPRHFHMPEKWTCKKLFFLFWFFFFAQSFSLQKDLIMDIFPINSDVFSVGSNWSLERSTVRFSWEKLVEKALNGIPCHWFHGSSDITSLITSHHNQGYGVRVWSL